MHRVERDREQRSLLPFECMALGLAFLPDLRGAPALHDKDDLLIKMAFDIERAGAWNLRHIHAPQPFGAVELDVTAASAETLPRRYRQILDATHANAAKYRNAFRLHETVIGHRLAQEFSEARILAGLRFMPMGLVGGVVHGMPQATIALSDGEIAKSPQIFFLLLIARRQLEYSRGGPAEYVVLGLLRQERQIPYGARQIEVPVRIVRRIHQLRFRIDHAERAFERHHILALHRLRCVIHVPHVVAGLLLEQRIFGNTQLIFVIETLHDKWNPGEPALDPDDRQFREAFA